VSAPFGTPNPSLALPAAPSVPQQPGPLHQVEFVVEVVGPASIPASAVAALLKPDWQAALGAPRIWVMAPKDTAWQPLTAAVDGSYDSLVMTWPYLSGEGHLTSRSAITLAGTAERFAAGVNRRALTIPPPNDVDAAVRAVREVAERLDIGVSVNVEFATPVPEEPIWRTAIELGLSLNGQGEFVWGDPAQATIVPLEEPQQYTLGGVRACREHHGLTIGFSAPLAVNPLVSLRAILHIAEQYAKRFSGTVFGDGGRPMDPKQRAEYERNLNAAVSAFTHVGLVSGGPEALRLFGG